ncbi:hypothetical protein D3C80_1452140 [compost metagenome]
MCMTVASATLVNGHAVAWVEASFAGCAMTMAIAPSTATPTPTPHNIRLPMLDSIRLWCAHRTAGCALAAENCCRKVRARL